MLDRVSPLSLAALVPGSKRQEHQSWLDEGPHTATNKDFLLTVRDFRGQVQPGPLWRAPRAEDCTALAVSTEWEETPLGVDLECLSFTIIIIAATLCFLCADCSGPLTPCDVLSNLDVGTVTMIMFVGEEMEA